MITVPYHVPVHFLPKVVTTAGRYFWLPLSAFITPFFVAASSGSFFFSFAYLFTSEFLRWILARILIASCDNYDEKGLAANDYIYCSSSMPIEYARDGVQNYLGSSVADEMSISAIPVGTWFWQRSILSVCAIFLGILASILRARLVKNQRLLTHMIKTRDEKGDEGATNQVQGIAYGDKTNADINKAGGDTALGFFKSHGKGANDSNDSDGGKPMSKKKWPRTSGRLQCS
jgi:hypothetical protein